VIVQPLFRTNPEVVYRGGADAQRDAPNATRVKTTRHSAYTISVVVASCRDRRLLDACLNSLEIQCRHHGAQIIVARKHDASELNQLTETYPFVHFVASPDSTIPRLRAIGLAAAQGDIIAMTEDHCVFAPDWIVQLSTELEGDTDVAGGVMDNAQRKRAIDWGAYFAEYGFFAENGGARLLEPLLTGANVAYSRRVVNDVVRWATKGEWENVIHAHLFAQGRSLQFLRTATVYQNQNYSFWAFSRDRFVHGRDYARRRLLDVPNRRWLYFVGSFLLPPVLIMRIAKTVGPHHRRPFVRSLPITFAFLTAWAIGEAVGYWYGPAKGAG
jgi:hypothetical protein